MNIRKIEAKNNKRKKRICAYVRVSTTNGSQLDSLENQKVYFEKLYAERDDVEFLGVFCDKGISGSKYDRPDFQTMLDACRKGQIDVIHTKSISRFARDLINVLEISRELKTLGIDIFFEEQNIHTLSNEGEVVLTVLASLAEEELQSMSGNQRWSFRRKFQKGELLINAKRFLGYDLNEKGELVINKAEAQIVRTIFYSYLEGMGTHRIAKKLNEGKVPTVTGKKWYDSTIRNILKNEKYKGSLLLQKYFHDGVNGPKKLNQGQVEQYYIEDNHEGIVSKEICQYCGSTLKRQVSYKKKIVWCCSKYIKEGKNSCKGMRVPERDIEDWKLSSPVIVLERIEDGEKHYGYTGQKATANNHISNSEKNQSSRLLSSVYRPRRTAIKL